MGSREGTAFHCGDIQAEGAREALLRGPLAFPQERLLSYFWNILKNEGVNVDEAGSWSEASAFQQQSAEVFMLLRSLVSLRLLTQVPTMCLVSLLVYSSPIHIQRVGMCSSRWDAVCGSEGKHDSHAKLRMPLCSICNGQCTLSGSMSSDNRELNVIQAYACHIL